MKAVWKDHIAAEDLAIYERSGLGVSGGFGQRPALIIVDMQYGFTGEEPGSLLAIAHPISCGEGSWQAVAANETLLEAFRKRGHPVFYTYVEGDPTGMNRDVGIKGSVYDHPTLRRGQRGTQIVEPLRPQATERVIGKKKPSAFFGTPLAMYLVEHGIDTVVVTGCTTSGCVRATVVDAFSHQYKVVVPEEAVFDRGQTSHAVNLFDMQMKYAEVVPLQDVLQVLQLSADKGRESSS